MQSYEGEEREGTFVHRAVGSKASFGWVSGGHFQQRKQRKQRLQGSGREGWLGWRESRQRLVWQDEVDYRGWVIEVSEGHSHKERQKLTCNSFTVGWLLC